MAGGRMDTPHPTPLDPPLVISYKSHRKSLVYFSHLARLILFFFTESHRQKGGVMAQCLPKYARASADVLLFTDIQRRAVEKKSSLS